MAMGAGLRPKAKGLDKPPDPTVRAPALDPTGRGRLDSLATKGLAAYLIATTRWNVVERGGKAADLVQIQSPRLHRRCW